MFTDTYFYSWTDVAPSAHPFDREVARAIVKDAASAVDRECALLLELGPWIYGWDWQLREPLSVFDGLCRWRALLEEVEATFAKVRRETLGDRDLMQAGFSSTVAQEIIHAAEQANAAFWLLVREDKWPSDTLPAFIQWFLESIGLRTVDVRGSVATAFAAAQRSRSRSSVGMDSLSLFDASARPLAWDQDSYVRKDRARKPIYGNTWIQTRERVISHFHAVSDRDPIPVDGHQHYIQTVERPRDPKRADAMAVALDACRVSAAAGEPLTRAHLADWHRVAVSGDDTPTAPEAEDVADPAEHPGLERMRNETDAALTELLTQVNAIESNDAEPARDVALRALLVYLDVFYLRPFKDGNHRVARLALDHTLMRAGLGLHAAEPVFALRLASRAYGEGDPAALKSLAIIVESLIGAS